jgi:hypothetical protein
MITQGITGFQAALDRLNRPRQALIHEARQTLSVLHLTRDDLPAILYLLDALLAGVEEGRGEVERRVTDLKQAIQFRTLADGSKT